MIRSYWLEKKEVRVLEATKSLPKKKLVWLHCLKPQEEDLKELERLASIPYEDLSVAMDEEIHPYAAKENHVELVYRTPLLEDGDIVTEPLAIFFKKNLIVTMTQEKLKVIHQLKRRLAANKSKHLLMGSSAYFVQQLIDEINDDFLNRIEKVTHTIDLFEEQNVKEKNFRSLYGASLTSAHFNQALLGNAEVLNLLRKMHHSAINKDDRDVFYDLYLDNRQLLDTEKIQRELITNLFTLQNVLANQQLDRKLSLLTVLALFIAVPTMISGLYGMNINDLPLASHTHAFWIIGGVMVLLVLLLIVLFKILDWF